MREKDFLGELKRGGYPSGNKPVSEIKPPFTKAQLAAIDRADEQEDALSLDLDCMCKNNDPNCAECWDVPIKFKIVKDHKGNLIDGPKKVSDSVSNANLVHARELEITAVTTVSELYEMIDLPYRITKHAKVSIGSKYDFPRNAETPVLRLEWRGDGE